MSEPNAVSSSHLERGGRDNGVEGPVGSMKEQVSGVGKHGSGDLRLLQHHEGEEETGPDAVHREDGAAGLTGAANREGGCHELLRE